MSILPRTLALALSALAVAPSAQGGFVERAAELGLEHSFAAGLDRVGDLFSMSDWTQQGIALGDVDADGDTDVVVAGRLTQNSLFLRQPDGTYVDVATSAGIQSPELDNAPALGDYDRDGDLDLFLGSVGWGSGPKQGNDRLYRNEGNARGLWFEDVSTLAGVRGAGQTLDALWCDAQSDGWLDLYVCSFHGTNNLLYVNNADGTFVDRAAEWGALSGGSTHVGAFVDIDRDDLPDLLVGNDWNVTQAAEIANIEDDLHLAGKPGGGFQDVTSGSGYPLLNGLMNDGSTTMGIALGDVDYDGDYEVYRTQWGEQSLVRYAGWPASGEPWVGVQLVYGVDDPVVADPQNPFETGPAVGWGCAFGHFDFDPWLDLYKVNGHVNGQDPRQQPNRMFRGQGPQFAHVFEEVGASWGVAGAVDDRALAVGDLDRDNDLDFLVGPAFGALRYYENQLDRQGQGGVAVELLTQTSAPHGIGAEVGWWDESGLPHVRPIGADAPCASQREYLAFLGLGAKPNVDLSVVFPSGLERKLVGVPSDERVLVEEPQLFELSQTHYELGVDQDPLTVRVFAHDRFAKPLGPGVRVRIEADGLSALGPVSHVGHNIYERSFAAPSQAGEYAISADIAGFAVRTQPRVRVVGGLDASATRMELNPQSVRAGTQDTSVLTVAPLDAGGRSLGAGRALSIAFQGQLHELTDLGDGRYRATLAASFAPGTLPVQLLEDGAVTGASAVLVAAGAPTFEQSFLLHDYPDEDFAQSPHRYKFEVQPRDAAGRALGPATQLTVVAEPDAFGVPVAVLDECQPNGRRDGSFFFVLERSPASPAGSATGLVRVLADGVEIAAKPYSF